MCCMVVKRDVYDMTILRRESELWLSDVWRGVDEHLFKAEKYVVV